MSTGLIEKPSGLSTAEVQERMETGQVNAVPASPVRSMREIVRANVFTPVNAVMITLFVLILIARSPGDALFVGVVFSNSLIGILQELRARKELERLAVLNAPRARVIRNGTSLEIGVEEVVAEDVLELGAGDQAVVDGEIVSAIGLEMDESLLTGESVSISKEQGDEILSGSFAASGSGYMRATKIGADSYASKLSEEAKQFTLTGSELKRGINWIIKILMIIIPPATILLFLTLLRNDESPWQEDLRSLVGAAVAMVPDGLVLLTSMAFLAGVLTLARHKTLAKELATVEMLARVDVLCLDKTGTITTGAIAFDVMEPLGDFSDEFCHNALGAFAGADPSPNATMKAVADSFTPPAHWSATGIEPFSSDRKWSAVEFSGHGLFYFGAPDILLAGDSASIKKSERHTKEGKRVLALCKSLKSLDDHREELPDDIEAVALVLLEDEIRPDAREIFGYFLKRGVRLKVISGDTVNTVAVVAERAGITGAKEKFIDARELPAGDSTNERTELAEIMEENTVFGRVTPHQKRAMVKALQSKGRIVAMTGDGVNDVLALKDADMGIAMGSGSTATRAVASLVLLDNRFSTLPKVLTESRKVINNVERVANLFITKAVYEVLITAGIGIAQAEFAFLPRHLTLIGTISIGLPGLVLVLAPSAQKIQPGFIKRALTFSLPAGALAAIGTGITYGLAGHLFPGQLEESRSVATFTLLGIGLFILAATARPFALWKLGLVLVMALFYALIIIIPFAQDYFQLDLPDGDRWIWLVVAGVVSICGLLILLIPRFFKGLLTEEDNQ